MLPALLRRPRRRLGLHPARPDPGDPAIGHGLHKIARHAEIELRAPDDRDGNRDDLASRIDDRPTGVPRADVRLELVDLPVHPAPPVDVPTRGGHGPPDRRRPGVDRVLMDVDVYALAVDHIVATLKARGWLTGKIGLQLGSYRPNRAYSEVFEARLRAAGAEITDGTKTVAHVSRFKSEIELDAVREAAAIGDAGMHALVNAVSEGTSELELWAAATSARRTRPTSRWAPL